MSIKIEILDPHKLDQNTILKTAKYLMDLVNINLHPGPTLEDTKANLPEHLKGFSKKLENLNTETGETVPGWVPPAIPESQHPQAGSTLTNKEIGMSPTWAPLSKPIQNSEDVIDRTLPKGITMEDPEPEPVATSDLDSSGKAWDARIHSRTKSKTSDGKWRYMRSLNQQTIDRIEAEIFKKNKTVASNPPIPAPVPVPPLVNLTPPPNFPEFMNKIMAAVNSQKITPVEVTSIVREFGLPSIPVVATRPEIIPEIIAKVDLLIASRST